MYQISIQLGDNSLTPASPVISPVENPFIPSSSVTGLVVGSFHGLIAGLILSLVISPIASLVASLSTSSSPIPPLIIDDITRIFFLGKPVTTNDNSNVCMHKKENI